MVFRRKSIEEGRTLKRARIQICGRIQGHGCMGSGHHSVAYVSTKEQDMPCSAISACAHSLHADEPGLGSPWSCGEIL